MKKEYIEPFINSITTITKKMANIDIKTIQEAYPEKSEFNSKGVTSIISFQGKIGGRFIIDMNPNVAIVLTKKITGQTYSDVKEHMVLSTVSELNNIVAGAGLTKINNEFKLGLRLVPPVVFTGEDTLVCLDKIPSESIVFASEFGEIRVNVAFEGGEDTSG